MKTIFHISLFLACAGLALQSCTKISEPFYTVKAVYADTTKRFVLLEDYTGHLCINCAPAGKMANSLQELYSGQVYAIAVHAGDFAKPISSEPYLTADFTCQTGNDWNSTFKIPGNPYGMVNRRPWKGQASFVPTEWTSAIQYAVTLPKVAVMTVHNTFDTQKKILSTAVNIKFLIDYPGSVNLTVCILEDSIYGGQMNSIKPDSTPMIKHYRFMHVLRGSLNGSFGEPIANSPKAKEYISKTYSFDFSPKTWIPKNCSVIAFIAETNSKEVLHVVKAAVIKP